MTTPKITLQRVREIISEEVGSAVALQEFVDHKGFRTVTNAASELLEAVEDFEEEVGETSPAAVNAVSPHLSELKRVLEDMVSSPGSYVAAPKREPKTVTLKAAAGK